MAQPPYEASVQPDSLPGRPAPRFPDEISPQAEGAGIGRAIQDVGSVVQQVVEKAQSQARQTQVTDANNQLQTLMLGLTHDPKTGAFTKQGKDAFGLSSQYLPQYDAQSQAIVDAVPDERARQAAVQMQAHVRNQLSEQLDTHEISQHEKYGIQTAQASVKLAQQQAASNYNHADIIASNHETIDLSLQNLAQRQGWSPDELNQARQEAYSSLHTDVIDRMLADDKPVLASHYLDTVKGEMDSSKAFAASRTINEYLRQKDNEAKQDIADRFQDSMQAAQFGLPNPVTVTRKEMDVLYPKDAQRRWDGLQMTVESGAQARQYDQMTPGDIQVDLAKRLPTQGGPEATYQIHNYDMLTRAADQSLKARAADPAQFAIDTGQGWKPLDFRSPQNALAELRSRANSADTVGEQIGGPVSLLTKGEAKQVADALDSAPPTQRLSTLTALYQAMPDERAYFSVLHQISPHSPVTAIVGQKVSPNPLQSPSWYDPNFAASPADAERILTGESLLNPQGTQKGDEEKGGFKQGFPMPPDSPGSGLHSQFARASADMFRDRPELADAHYAAFRDAYAALMSEKGDLSGVQDSSTVAKALKMSLGTTVDFNGQTLSVPGGMDPTKFQGNVARAVELVATASGAPADWKNRISGYQLRELGALGSGRYELVNGNAPLVRPNGKGPFVIDLGALPTDTSKPFVASREQMDSAAVEALSR